MKHTCKLYLFGFLFILFLTQGCKKGNYWEKDVRTSITAPTNLQPLNSDIITLDPNSNAVTVLSWDKAHTADQTMVFYKVLFDKANGDFTHAIDSIATGHVGSDTTLNLTDKELNILAEKAGIEELSEGTVIWKVMASNGVVAITSDNNGELKVQRPAGFALLPSQLSIYGDATESNDQSQPLSFKKIGEGVFEIYTSLSNGNYELTDGSSSFQVEGNSIKKGTKSTSPTTEKKAYRIHIDFNVSQVVLTEIKTVGLWFAADNKVTMDLPYIGDGVWKIENTPIKFSQQSWGKDERYKFRVTEVDMNGNSTNVFWSSKNKDNQRPTSSSNINYYYLAGHDGSQWDYTFKFMQESEDADIAVQFQSSGDYTHTVTYH